MFCDDNYEAALALAFDAFLAQVDGRDYPYYNWCKAHGTDAFTDVSCYMTLTEVANTLAFML